MSDRLPIKSLTTRDLRDRLRHVRQGGMRDRFCVQASSGREVRGEYTYSRIPGEKRPTLLTLNASAMKPSGQDTLWAYDVAVLGRLNKWELVREADKLDARCAATERGEPDGPDVNERDITKTDLWKSWPHDRFALGRLEEDDPGGSGA